jgi:GH25 family lysozyme M1 (1,4-beta-N-acetylmuramidase)
VQGIDVSDNQGAIAWAKVAAAGDVGFVLAKAAGERAHVDRQYARNRDACHKRGLAFGAYFFAHFDTDPIAQAHRFLVTAAPRAGELVPFLDVEPAITGPRWYGKTPTQVRAWVLSFLRAVDVKMPRPNRRENRCGVYVSPGIANELELAKLPGLAARPLWVADWRVKTPTIPAPWHRATFWQYTDRARVAGVAGPVDGDRLLWPCDPLACHKL